jgi:hypothetical protein
VAYQTAGMVVFASRETGQFTGQLTDPGGRNLPLHPRHPRIRLRPGGRTLGQVHHHGSIDNPDAPRDYQDAITAG